ncbi:MAG: hypothetical protein HKN26_05685 [Acidimicrobiales bacterium]|nr:hypothetical protein [Acidimicrobiales bacterium]
MSRAVLLAFAMVAAMIVVGAVLTADDEATPAERQLGAAIASDLLDEEPGRPPTPYEPTAAGCIGAQVVARVGIDRLTEIGLTPEAISRIGFRPHELSLTPDERISVVDAMEACVDLLEVAVLSLSPTGGQAARACVRGALGPDGARSLWEWRVGPIEVAQPDGLPAKLELVDDCLG